MTLPESWIERYAVRSFETDLTGTATPVALCHYLQETAGGHARALDFAVDQLRERGLTWMLVRLRLEITSLPSWREDIEVETWPSGLYGLFAARDYLLRNDRGDVTGRATSAWLLIDLERRRPVRPTTDLLTFPLPEREGALPFASARLPAPQNEASFERTVHWTDIDLNEHVNNVRYVEWGLNTIPEDVLRTKQLRKLSVDYLGEATLGDTLEIVNETRTSSPAASILSEVRRPADDTPLARLLWEWE